MKRLQTAAIAGAFVLLALVFLLAWRRTAEAREFSQRYEAQTDEGTNYAAQLIETTVGRTDNGCVVIVYARLSNPNPFELTLARDRFLLQAEDGHRYSPSTSGTQTNLIKLPANGVSEREAFSFLVPESSFQGAIRLQIGRNSWAGIKDSRPWEPRLRSGQFRTFRRRYW